MREKKYHNSEEGSLLVYNIVIIFIFSMVMIAVLGYATSQLRLLRSTVNREMAFQIAEAGANYYQWRLAHFPTDYWDGNASTTPGPYIHDYIDKDTNTKIGEYSLNIIKPALGSTIVTIQSTGYTTANPNQKRTVTARYGVPSLAKYAFLTNSDIWIGSTSNMNGELHANGGIRFDGTGNALIQSSRSTYTCQPIHGCSPAAVHTGVWGSAAAATQSFWRYPVPNVDFSSITADLAAMKSSAQVGGIYLPPSSAQGYSIVFSTTTPSQAVRVYRVTNLRSHATGYDVNGVAHNEYIDYSTTGRTLLFSTTTPSNGLIFVEDKVWVEGTLKGRVTIGSARFPYNASNAMDIMIPNNIVYDSKNGSDSLGLIAQRNVLLTYYAPNNLEINAAIIAQNGSYQRYNFSGNVKNTLTVFGSISSFGVSGTYWPSSPSGYQTRFTTYDTNLLYGPPPNFPLATGGYQQISWGSN